MSDIITDLRKLISKTDDRPTAIYLGFEDYGELLDADMYETRGLEHSTNNIHKFHKIPVYTVNTKNHRAVSYG